MSTYQFFNRDLSWLSFNNRVLEEARNKNLPLYERIKFLAIYSSNLDEFYRVRVASYQRFIELPIEDKRQLRRNPDLNLVKIKKQINKQQIEFGEIFTTEIVPELLENNIVLIQGEELSNSHYEFTKDFFSNNLLQHMQPMLLQKKQIPYFPKNNAIYFAVKLYKERSKKNNPDKPKRAKYALIRIPNNKFDRFIELPSTNNKHHIVFLDDIVKLHMEVVFPGFKIDSTYSFKMSRAADILIEDEYSGDIMSMIENNLKKRETSDPSRFLYDRNIPRDFLNRLKLAFNLTNNQLVKGARYHNFQDFFNFPNPAGQELEDSPFHALKVKDLGESKSIFKVIREEDILLHYPYQSYEYVIRFFNEAAIDPKVQEIKATQYRVAENSAIVNALINAALNGKKVTVLVELKARFDEEANMNSARAMTKAGVKIIYSLPGLKVHAKIALVIRKDDKDDYAYLSTGNFNEQTARIYADHGFFTSDKTTICELKLLFDYLENQETKCEFNKLLIGQFNMRNSFLEKIDREIKHVENGKKGYLILKMNGLQEREMIKKLYEASSKGVKIDLIIRGICCLIPNKSYSKNIRIIRIVDKFLEHARIFYFHNNGKSEVFLSSADWMARNLHRRIECAFPIEKPKLKQELIDILNIQLKDNTNARIINEHLENIKPPKNINDQVNRAQIDIFKYLENIELAKNKIS
ncbi:polyphosphate kinase 1 [Ancylomarina sp. 16SWW S1-10-2]|uniref:polyphosphate kinase 1 n=1 Tax=Ancylomarina sp. 16SWW S1-10-2 TaxID=2499681 RepID=UPI0012AE53B2|nr:polyphosphate kinase 1 [Ancylomarina sp. 16SWW S1-10-2]MRT92622.1 polyphosphate kinase 1 [Ancylomarina sp. 16SWW S1-10-2]